jgi:hypothetical protein
VTHASEPLSITDPVSETNSQSYPAGCSVISWMPKWPPSNSTISVTEFDL